MASSSSRKKNQGQSPIVKPKQILNWRNMGAKSLANEKRKQSPTVEKCFKRTKSDAMEGNDSNSSEGSDDGTTLSESSTSEGYDSESEIEISRHGDSDGADNTVFLASVDSSNRFKTPEKVSAESPSFNTPEKKRVSEAEVANDCPKKPVKPKRVSSCKASLKPASLMIASYSEFLSGTLNGKPQTSTPIFEKEFSKFPADLSAVPTTERSAANIDEPIGDKPYSPRTRRRILQELPDKYPICKLDKLKYRKPLPGEMTILKSQVQFLRSTNND